jgi:hypothetical protein
MVKLADRITNLQPPPGHWDAEKIERYREEGRVILRELGDGCPYLADRLDNKVKVYV